MGMEWDYSRLADRIGEVLRGAEERLRLEQAVYGLDAMEEIQWHPMLAEGLRGDYEVAREVHYPSSVGNKLTHRKRCDLVLSALGHPLKLDRSAPTLFDPAEPTEPEGALWLEVKVAHQFRLPQQRDERYGAQWQKGIIDDLMKMDQEVRIRQAGMLLIVFNESAEVLEKDVELFEMLLARQEVLAGERQVRSVEIWDRMGHGLCTAAIWPTVVRG
ncbi:MAG: hypothetical protein IT447_04525 [Phycisphaerales bacterium]|jgi:hypothetical protein|nr:hypothetical protein [Phycisphaerales bacterium]